MLLGLHSPFAGAVRARRNCRTAVVGGVFGDLPKLLMHSPVPGTKVQKTGRSEISLSQSGTPSNPFRVCTFNVLVSWH
jgi:hypothetical protein